MIFHCSGVLEIMITLFSSYLLNNEILTHKEVKKTLRHQVIKDGTLDTIIYELKFLSLKELAEMLEDAYKNDTNFFKKDFYKIDSVLTGKFGLGNVMRYNILPVAQDENAIYCFVKSDINEKNLDFVKKEFNKDVFYNVIPEVIFENLKVKLKISEINDRFQEHLIENLDDYIHFEIIRSEDITEKDEPKQVSTSIKSSVEDFVELTENEKDVVTISSFKEIEKNTFFDIVHEEIDNLDLLEKKLAHSIEDKELIIDTLLSFLVSRYKLVSFWGKAGETLKLVKYLFMNREDTSKIEIELPINTVDYLNEIYVNKKHYLVHKTKINRILDVFYSELNKYYEIDIVENILLFPLFIKERWIGLFIIDNRDIDFTVDDFASFEIISNLAKGYLEEYILYKKQSLVVNNPISEVIIDRSLEEQNTETSTVETEINEAEASEPVETEIDEAESEEEVSESVEIEIDEAESEEVSESVETEIDEAESEEEASESVEIEIDEAESEEEVSESVEIEIDEAESEEETSTKSKVQIFVENIKEDNDEENLDKLNDLPSIDEEYEEKAPEVFNKSSYYFKTREEYIKDEDRDDIETLEQKKIDLPVLDLSEVNIIDDKKENIENEEVKSEKQELEMSRIIVDKKDEDTNNSKTNIEINLTEEEVEVKNEHTTVNSELIDPINMKVEDFIDKLNNATRSNIDNIISDGENLSSFDVMDKIMDIFPGRLWMNEIDAYNFIVPIEQHGPVLYYLTKNKEIELSKLKDFFNSNDNQKKFYSIYIYTKVKDEDIIPNLINKITDRVVSLVAIKALENHKNFKVYTRIKYKFESAVHSKMPSIVIDWITAIRMLRDEFFVPILIDALDTWKKEKVIKNKIVELLIELTKQDFGDSERKWSKWWANNQYKMRKDWVLDGLIHKKKKIRISALNEAKKCFKSLYNYTIDLSTKEQLRIIDKIKEDEYNKRRGVF